MTCCGTSSTPSMWSIWTTIFSKTAAEHTRHVHRVLQRLLENRLFIKAEKCMFSAASVEFLGHVLEEGRVRADPKKVQAVEEWQRPTDRTQLRRFLGFANFYRRFIRGFSRVGASLSALTSTSNPFFWTPEAEDAFVALKRLFTTALVLIFPDPNRQFIVQVDASDTGIGAVLSQRSEEDQQIHPVAFLSRRFYVSSVTTTWGTETSWLCTPSWRSEDTGWRGPNTPCSYGPTTRT